MTADLLSDFWDFVDANRVADPAKLRLKYHSSAARLPFDVELAISQIECRRRFAKKLSITLARFPHWLFPSVLSGEQSTSDLLAIYHSSLIDQGDTVVDLTAGLGIDAWHLSQKAKSVTACDIEIIKTDALSYNIASGDISNLTALNIDCREFLKHAPECDVMFIDPARRSDTGGRVYALSDCQPPVVDMIPDIRSHSKRLIVKMSPMLDITQTLRDLPHTSRIIALGTPTECKELVSVVDFDQESDPEISAVTLYNDGCISDFSFKITDNELARVSTGIPQPGEVLYLPYPAVMKAAPFRLLCSRFGVTKVHNNTHLYFSQEYHEDFPGEKLQILDILPFASKHIKRLKRTYPKINVATRNFSISADSLRSKLGIADGGDLRLIGATLADGQQAMIIAQGF